MLIFDCSNSNERPTTRGYGGSVENAVITILKKYGPYFNVSFTKRIEYADILLTNDVFPKWTLSIDKPKVKRMDGVFWQNNLKSRNLPYLRACEEADLVIFVSKYSQDSLVLYPNTKIKQSNIVLNWVDEELFKVKLHNYPEKFIAVATSWIRPEKNLRDLLWFAQEVIPNNWLYLVGNLPNIILPKNVVSLGYIEYNLLNNTLCKMDGLINFSYRDAAPKVVAEAICCGLPIFYANSGGVSELVRDFGVSWKEFTDTPNKFEDDTPTFSFEKDQIKIAFQEYLDTYKDLHCKILTKRSQTLNLIENYISLFRSII